MKESMQNPQVNLRSTGKLARFTARWLCIPAFAFLSLYLAGCKSPSQTVAEATTETAATSQIARLHEGDTIKVIFEADTNMNTTAKIQIEGHINLPLAGDVKAAGKTLEELKAELKTLYTPLLRINEIDVKLLDSFASVTLSGAVVKPGRLEMDRPLTVLDAVMEAGGYNQSRARLDKTTVLRIENGQQKLYKINLRRVIDGKDTSPFYLKPFDIVHIPEKRFNF